MKILVNCYACSPYKGSEPGMGWKFVNELSKYHELHIITEGKFEADIRKYLSEHPEREKDFHFYFLWKERHKKLRKIWPPSYYWFYKAWQKRAFKLAIELEEKENFDVIHQLNMVGFREPGYFWKIDKPYVWGPIGGVGLTPWCMIPSMGLRGAIYYLFYNCINLWQMYTMGRVKRAMAKSDALISATQKTREAILKLYGKDSVIIPEVGLEEIATNMIAQRAESKKLRICWSGQHTPGKSLNLLLDSLALCNRNDYELHVLGVGSQTNKWKKQAKRLNLDGNITWYGWIDRAEALNVMQSCHLFCITSLADLTSTVLLEALSYGMPVIALDHCGFSNVIHEGCGRKIAIRSKKQVINDFADAINELADNEPLRRKLAKGARERAMEYNWQDKAAIINKIYDSVSV